MTTIHTILEELTQAATDPRDKGNKFERLMTSYLKRDPLYHEKYSEVWCWDDWPDRNGRPDTGIDLVAKERDTGDYCAIQCKFYSPSRVLQKQDIDSFFTASGKAPFTSRIIISTTDKWSSHAEEALENQQIPVTRLRVQDLEESVVDWGQFSLDYPDDITLKPKKRVRPHQTRALEQVKVGFEAADRGKLIMACGTGKTFTSLKIAEQLVPSTGLILFLVPSISLLSQTLREWMEQTACPLRAFAVCSDTTVGKKKSTEDISVHDLAYPATTNATKLLEQFTLPATGQRRTVIFSTYQSIQVLHEAQAQGLPEFDLVVCDEAHRTTGMTLAGEDESHFVRVHDQRFLQARKRLYMTATPRIYTDSSKLQAQEKNAMLCSMDDECIFGKEFHRLGFGEAVEAGLLADYKVMVLAVDEKYVSKTFQWQLADANNELTLEDAVKIVGCWNGLSRRGAEQPERAALPMRRAVAFARSIKDSRKIAKLFASIIAEYHARNTDDDTFLACQVEHVDGSFNVLKRNALLDWLKEDTSNTGNVCRILSNARCLSEGVDVPALDAVLFLNPRDSVVDVVQSVGRVMRKSEGKDYGYIILPIGIPADIPPETALNENKSYSVVWQVLQALRAHDDRFNAMVNKIDLNKSPDEHLQVIGVSGSDEEARRDTLVQPALSFPELEEWRGAIYAKIVQKCGDRRYWEDWAKDVAQIAERHTTRIKALLEGAHPEHRAVFDAFLSGLRESLNQGISEDDAIEMLSQHLITKPVFDALFEGYAFTQHNPVSLSMQKVLDVLEGQALEKETETLDTFYASVKQRASGIDTAKGKQTIILELYNKFFRSAFPRMAERLGIVYTPVEVVDFIIRSADYALRLEFGVDLSESGVHVLDPFTGTGTFLVRLLQSGLIKPENLLYKYQHELHANEIVLLAYYIAAINIEATYHGLAGGAYQPFDSIVLTDTFQMTEGKGTLDEVWSPENNQRVRVQNQADIRVIMGNPPYSVGQKSQNDANQNLKYPRLDERIRQSYAEHSTATNKNSLYDSYIRAFRWASDRIKDKGIVCFVSNGSYIDGNAADGMRKRLIDEFTAIYCFNLRGNARTQGEQRRKEKGNVFGEGSRTPIAITLLVKNPDKAGNCELHYHDIGDYLSREEKLQKIAVFGSVEHVPWEQLTPNVNYDWINQRNLEYETFIPLADRDDKSNETKPIFLTYSCGLQTNRDPWAYNFSKSKVAINMDRMINFYNTQVKSHQSISRASSNCNIDDFIDKDAQKISWTRNLKKDLGKAVEHAFSANTLVCGIYRPFCKEWVYLDRSFNEYVYQMQNYFPNEKLENQVICISGRGATCDFSVLITNIMPNVETTSRCQCFPLYRYEKRTVTANQLPGMESYQADYVKTDAISSSILAKFQKTYNDAISKEDIFYYVYGILHSPEYIQRFATDLKKMLPRIPYARDFWAFSKAGRELAHWHLNYEQAEPYPVHECTEERGLDPKERYRVSKMAFRKQGKEVDKSTILYNSHITLSGIPLDAYAYVVNGKSALEWVMERYQVTVDKESGIANDPNDWSEDPRYILDLMKRIVRVSLETVRIVRGLPAMQEMY